MQKIKTKYDIGERMAKYHSSLEKNSLVKGNIYGDAINISIWIFDYDDERLTKNKLWMEEYYLTGKNDNVIIVMCESLEWYAINPVLTPNLYNIFTNGYRFDNYYSKSKTNYSEMDVILGSVPTDNAFTNSWHGSTSSLLGNELTFTLPNKFKNAGYESIKYFHNYILLDNGKLDEYKSWLESNTNYTFPTDKKHKTYLRNYLATTMDLDKGIGILIDYLKENNLYDNTTLVVYGDHNAYYHDLSYKMRYTKKEDFRNIELYRVPAVI